MTLIPDWRALDRPLPPYRRDDALFAVLRANHKAILRAQRAQNWTDMVFWQDRLVSISTKNKRKLLDSGFLVRRISEEPVVLE